MPMAAEVMSVAKAKIEAQSFETVSESNCGKKRSLELKNRIKNRERWQMVDGRWKTSRLAFGKLNCFRFCSHFPALFAFAASNK